MRKHDIDRIKYNYDIRNSGEFPQNTYTRDIFQLLESAEITGITFRITPDSGDRSRLAKTEEQMDIVLSDDVSKNRFSIELISMIQQILRNAACEKLSIRLSDDDRWENRTK